MYKDTIFSNKANLKKGAITTRLMVIVLLLTLAVFSLFIMLFSNINKLNSQVRQSNNTIQGMQEEMARIQAEKDKVTKENEKIQGDIVSYLALNAKLGKEKDEVYKKLEEAQKIIENKEADLQRGRLKLEELSKRGKDKNEQDKLVKEKNVLQGEIKLLEDKLNQERALYHYNLGVAYTQAKLYDEAIEAYKKSLSFDIKNPETHYNLGLIYQNVKLDPDKAVKHYRSYLELKPEAEDKEEVSSWIEKLK